VIDSDDSVSTTSTVSPTYTGGLAVELSMTVLGLVLLAPIVAFAILDLLFR